ncbi:hypothetical protein [Anaeromyxobacter oryzae]|uniref:YXWGXW repeat-containing protein n=1 Tax=Anaeromyxobacter oryzae TaxID=2918170 RepID=A0ABM7WUY8_9BACT|nr:hypothetical protein [Anaeromyxobacter oryzae]BDG03301.1 hypothetical protein AMOR_22970 [Anaeromyxobacter oryzae]
MKKTLLLVAGLLVLPAIARAQAQAQVTLQLGLPVVLPQLVVVSPGVQVVPDVEEEVFFVDGYYWCRHDGGWYRSRNHRGGWVVVPRRGVPARLYEIPPGRYRHYRPGPPRAAPAPVRYERYERDDRHFDKHHEKEMEKREREERHHDNGRGKGHEKHGD